MWLDTLSQELLDETRATRITIRLADPEDPYFPVKGEATVDGFPSLKGTVNDKLLTAPTFLWVKNNLGELLVQDDVLTSEPVFPDLVEIYGIRAQVLAPVIRNGELAGLISVHWADGPRHWTETEFAALRHTSEKLHEELARRNWEIGGEE